MHYWVLVNKNIGFQKIKILMPVILIHKNACNINKDEPIKYISNKQLKTLIIFAKYKETTKK